jgi:CheY-specific phosphatase CheX
MRAIRNQELSRMLAEATEQVLETMFFTTIEGRLDSLPETMDTITATLSFQGELMGTFCLDLSSESAWRVAASFLATEPDVLPRERVAEAVCELANMICGRTLSQMQSEDTFELLAPHLEAQPVASTAGPTHIFQLEDGYLRVSLEIQPQTRCSNASPNG